MNELFHYTMTIIDPSVSYLFAGKLNKDESSKVMIKEKKKYESKSPKCVDLLKKKVLVERDKSEDASIFD
jgi:hypothetical protein